MADTDTGNAAAPTAPEGAPGQPAANQGQGGDSQIPAGHRLVSDSDFERYVRAEQQARGSRAFFQKASEFGIKRPEDFEAWAPVLKFGKPDVLAQILQGGEPPSKVPEDQAFDPEAFKAQLMGEFRSEQAEREWLSQVTQHEAMIEEFVNSLEGADDTEKELMKAALAHRLESERDNLKWPDGHPLASKGYRPAMTRDAAKPVFDWAANARKKLRGTALAQIGDAAAKGGTPSTPAGNKGGQGQPENEGREDRAKRVLRGIAQDAVAKAGVS